MRAFSIIGELIYPWIKTLRKHEEYIRGLPVKSSRRRTSVIYIIITNALGVEMVDIDTLFS
jgi:hypothetical protein